MDNENTKFDSNGWTTMYDVLLLPMATKYTLEIQTLECILGME
jgi:hypothetical protein